MRVKRIVLANFSSPVDRERLERGRKVIEARWGPVEFLAAPGLFETTGYLAGTDAARVESTAWAFAAAAEIVWAVRGGFGVTRILDKLDIPSLANSGKMLLGFSDVTALLVAYEAAGGRAIHAPMPAADLGDGNSRSIESLSRIVFGDGVDEFSFAGEMTADRMEGTILAANIVVLASIAGTRHFPSGAGRIVCLEEIGEEPYRVDRALTQLLSAGLFSGATGVVFGSMKDCVPEDSSRSASIEETLLEFGRRSSLPVCLGFPFGHGIENSALPLGGTMTLVRRGDQVRARVSI